MELRWGKRSVVGSGEETGWEGTPKKNSPQGRGARWVPGFLGVPGGPAGTAAPPWGSGGAPKPFSPRSSPLWGAEKPPRHSPPRPCLLCCPSVREAPSRPGQGDTVTNSCVSPPLAVPPPPCHPHTSPGGQGKLPRLGKQGHEKSPAPGEAPNPSGGSPNPWTHPQTPPPQVISTAKCGKKIKNKLKKKMLLEGLSCTPLP